MISRLEFGILGVVQIVDGLQDIRGIRFMGCMHMFFQFVCLKQGDALVHPARNPSKQAPATPIRMTITFKNTGLLEGHPFLKFANDVFSKVYRNIGQ